MKRRFFRFRNLVLLAVVVLLAAGYWLLGTASGARFVLARVDARLPGALTAEGLDGKLWNGLGAETLRYEDDKQTVTLRQFAAHWRLPPLIDSVLEFATVEAASVSVARKSSGSSDADLATGSPDRIELPQLNLPLTIRVGAVVVGELSGVGPVINDISLTGTWQGSDIAFADASLTVAETRVEASGELSLRNEYPLQASGRWQRGELSGDATLGGTLGALEVEHQLQTVVAIASRGTVDLLRKGGLTASLSHRCIGECVINDVRLNDLVVATNGPLDSYATEVAATVVLQDIPEQVVSLTGQGSLEGLRLDTFDASSIAGTLGGTGRVDWKRPYNVSLQWNADISELQTLLPSVNGAVTGSGKLALAPDSVAVTGVSGAGTVNGYDFIATGGASRTPAGWHSDAFSVALGDNRVSGNASLRRDQLAGTLDVQAPVLEQLQPGLDGSVTGKVTLAGSLSAPVANGKLVAENLRWQLWKIAGVVADFSDAGTPNGRAELSITGIDYPDLALGNASAALRGAPEQFDGEISLGDGALTVDTLFGGAWRDGELNATLSNAELGAPRAGAWLLQEPVALFYNAQSVRASAHSWESENAILAIETLEFEGDSAQLNTRLERLPLALVRPWLPPELLLRGALNADLNATRENGRWLGQVTLGIDDAQVSAAGSTVPPLNLSTVSLNADITRAESSLKLTLRGDNQLAVDGDLQVLDTIGAGELSGEINALLPSIAPLGALVPELSGLDGEVTSRLTVAGPWRKPQLDGTLRWQDGGLTVNSLATRFDDIDLSAQLNNRGGTLDGVAYLDGQALEMGGTVSLDEEPANALVTLKGENLLLANLPDYVVRGSPDLEIRITPEGARWSGTMTVPNARINYEIAPAAVRRSPDVVIVGEKAEGDRFTLAGELDLVLGEDVFLEFAGLKTYIGGELELTTVPDGSSSADGRLALRDGEFAAYGQQLSIDKGELFFAGPIDEPLLDVEASRQIPGSTNVKAGVRVSGSSRALRTSVFSEPALPDTEALSYLVFGRPTSVLSSANGEALSGAAVALGLSRSSPLTSGLAGGLGLDELSLAGSSEEDATVVAGKQLSNDLYIRYSFGVFSRLGSLLLRYRLSDNFSLEAGAAESQSLDLLYSIER